MTRHRISSAAWLLCSLLFFDASAALATPFPLDAANQTPALFSDAPLIRFAQVQMPAPATQPASAAPSAAADRSSDEEPIGNVVKLTGTATLTRNNASTPLKLKDDIFKNDVLKTSANSTLGVTFNDATTFNLNANAQITIDNFVYEDGGKTNAALFNIGVGTVAFVASAVAKTGDMKIATPTATLGIRGTSGLVEVPEGAAAAGTNNVNIKLYPDPDGRVGRIEVNGRDGARLGFLTQAASGFAIRPGAGGRFAAAPLLISPQQVARDQGFVRQVHASQTFGRQIVTQQRAFRRANPARNNPAGFNPSRSNPARPGGPQNLNNNVPNRPGPPNAPALPGRQGQQPGTPPQNADPSRTNQLQAPGLQRLPGRPSNASGLQRPGRRVGPAPAARPAPSQKRKPPNEQR